MSYARGTEHYNLPQTVGTDKRDWFDTNTAFENVDADLYSAKQTADNAASDISSLTTRVGTAEGDISSLSTRVGNAEGDISALQGSVTGLGNDLADVKADLRDAICSVVEPDATADYAHAVDSYFWYNDTLYITTVAIAVGDTIVPNTNCNTTNVTTEIIKALSGGGSEIDDSTTALDKTWSSNKISNEITGVSNKVGDLTQLDTTDKTSLVNAVNEVKSDIVANKFGTRVNIISYTSAPYTFPSDGYVYFQTSTTAGNRVKASIYGATNDSNSFVFDSQQDRASYVSLFVRKGMRIKIDITTGSGYSAEFIPLTN